MVEVSDAILKARQFLEQVYSGAPGGLRVEEVESAEDAWYITLGFDKPSPTAVVRRGMGLEPERDYKVFKVNKTDGSVASMKIRQVG